ncbi:Acetolactate synthase-like protein, partial [Fragariocoptes setiger]
MFFTGLYYAFLVICVIQSFYPIFMILAMLVRQSRSFLPFFSPVDTTSKKHGGQLVAQVLKSHGIEHVFTLPGGHISPILTAAEQLKIRVVDVRHEATAVFAADAMARLTGRPGVAIVTAGPGLTNTVTAVKNAQMAESPVVVMSGAAATLLKGRGSLQDIEQLSLLKTTTKKQYTVEAVRDIVPTLREAFRVAQCGVPGPVFVEFPVDTLYPYDITAGQFTSATRSAGKQKPGLIQRLTKAYAQYSLDFIFAGAWQERDCSPHPVTVVEPRESDIQRAAQLLSTAKRPVAIVGTQATLPPYGPEQVAECVRKLGVPVFVNGGARGLLGSSYELQFRHSRSEAVREADVVLLLGAVCDFRLSYGRIFNRASSIISVNRSLSAARLNSPLFWRPTLACEADVGKFVLNLARTLAQRKQQTNSPTSDESQTEAVSDASKTLINSIDPIWLEQLHQRDATRNKAIELLAHEPVTGNPNACPLPPPSSIPNMDDSNQQRQANKKAAATTTVMTASADKLRDAQFVNPLKVVMALDKAFAGTKPTLVADGGDFVATASYILRPDGAGRWLDPGPFGTLGCGAGFALAAKLLHPERPVVCVMGDGAFGYAIAEIDTFVRHKCHVMFVVGNDACWTQIAREQVPMLGSSISCDLAYTDYHKVAHGFGALGVQLTQESGQPDTVLAAARERMERDGGNSIVVNAIIGKTKFRDGSISV